MDSDEHTPKKSGRQTPSELAETVGAKENRKIWARKHPERSMMSWLGMMGLVGWAVAIPTVLGIALGRWLDATVPRQFSWTLTFLFIGVVLGCLNAWYWVKKEGSDDHEKKPT